jgi:hypothetical protein
MVPTELADRVKWTRNGSLLASIVAALLGAVHGVLGGGLPLWCYAVSVVSLAWVSLSMELLRRSLAHKRRKPE